MGYIILAVIAAAGLVASAVCHVMGWMQITPPGGKSVFALHIGILILWFPLVMFANRTMPKGARGNLEHLFAVLPSWTRAAAYGLFAYTFVNFAFFIYSASKYPKNGVPIYLQVRGFSGHWMLFYGLATLGFVALSRLAR